MAKDIIKVINDNTSEDVLLSQVLMLAKLQNWVRMHARPARVLSEDGGATSWRTAVHGDTGFPDVVLAKRGRVIFAELKSESGRLTPDQILWRKNLLPNQEYYTWRPSDWDQIVEVLSR